MNQAAKIRPSGVVVVSILMAWSGFLTIASTFPPFAPHGLPKWVIGIDIALGIAMLIVAWGLFVLRTWAYVVTLAVQAINGIFALITVITVPRAWPAWIALVIAGFIIYYLLRPQVREAFGLWRDVS